MGAAAAHCSCFILSFGYRHWMADPSDEKLTPSDPDDLAAALAFALKFEVASAGMTRTASWLTSSRGGS
jgi:hypothetical protein